MQLSIPKVPSYAESTAATSITFGIERSGDGYSVGGQAYSILDIAEEAAKVARKEWEALGKLDAEAARCINCEEWWRTSVKDVIRACIICSIAIATMKKGVQKAKGNALKDFLQAEMPENGQSYHDFWVVPKLSIR